jgi:hypothetical protein
MSWRLADVDEIALVALISGLVGLSVGTER